MKLIHQFQHDSTGRSTLKDACLAPCRKLLAHLKKAKAAILDEFLGALGSREHLLHLALNEAEALAWQSGVPQLVFPILAQEKAQALAAWHARQRSLQQAGWALAFAE